MGQAVTVKENHIVASVLRKVVFLATGRMGLPVAQLKAIYDIYEHDITTVLDVRKEFPGLTPLLTNSTVLGCLAFSRKVVPEASDKLMRALFSGKNLKAGMPAQALRMRLSTINKAEPPDDIKGQLITRATLDAVMATFDRRKVVSFDNSRTDAARTRLRAMSNQIISQIFTIIGAAESED